MLLYICRHGQTEGNVKHIVQGAGIDMPLIENGRQQAGRLKETMSLLNLPVIYCSRMKRARETAAIVASFNQAEVVPVPGLEEIHYGKAEGIFISEMQEKYKAQLDLIHDVKNPGFMDARIPGGESVRDSLSRAYKAFDEIKSRGAQKAIVVMHGGIMFNIYYDRFGLRRSFDNCDYFVLEW